MSVTSRSRLDRPAANRDIVAGLDTLRFFAAAVVAASHFTRNLPVRPENEAIARFFYELGMAANGRVAVALFFVISGFCIHFRQAENLSLNGPIFLSRRLVRIGLPLLTVLLVSKALGPWATAALETVLWSVYCELAYYVTYPMLLACRRQRSMERLMVVGTALAALLILVLPVPTRLWGYGIATAVICYPLWLVGAWLAERNGRTAKPSKIALVFWRLGAITLGYILAMMHRYWIGPAPWFTAAAVGLFSIRYLPLEIAHWRETAPPRWSERFGGASYSLYLVHILPVAYFLQFPLGLSFWPAAIAAITAIGACAYLAFLLCERPALRIAKSIGRGKLVVGSPTMTEAAEAAR